MPRHLRSAALATSALAALLACKPAGPLPLCIRETAEPSETRSLPPAAWFAALLPGYARDTREVAPPARDCTQTVVAWSAADTCPIASDAAALPSRPLGPEDLVFQPVDGDRALLWLVTQRFADGDGLGPAALIAWTDHGFRVWRIGPLRAPAANPRMRIEKLGKAEVLLVDAERCAPTGERCLPLTVVVPVVDRRFTPSPILGDGGRCDGPPVIERSRVDDLPLAGSRVRRFELGADVRVDQGALIIDEVVAVHELDPAAPDEPPVEYRRVTETRTIRLRGAALVADRPPLWPRVLADTGRVDGAQAAADLPVPAAR